MAESEKEDTGATILIPKYDLTGKKVARIYDFNCFIDGPALRIKRENHILLLKKSLERLEFQVQVLENLDDVKLKGDLKKIADDTEELACLWVFIMTTYHKEFFRCYKGCFRLEDLWKTFTGEKCKILFGKPKMFFIQMDVEPKKDNFTVLMNVVSPISREKKPIMTLPVSSDIMVAEFRRTEKDKNYSIGRFLSEELRKTEPRNMNTIMTSIVGRRWKETPRFSCTFCKQLYLPFETEFLEPVLQTTDGTSLEKYNVSGKRMAYSFIFRVFQNLEDLPGGQADKLSVEKAMKSRGFIYEDCNKDWTLTKDELKLKVAEIAKNTENADCVMIFVSTHGGDGHKLYAHDGQFTMHDLWTPFTENDGYKGKPKIFIIDGCRGMIGEERGKKYMYVAKGNVEEEETTAGESSSVTSYEVPKGGVPCNVEAESSLTALALEDEAGISSMDVDQGEFDDEEEIMSVNSDFVIGLSTINERLAVQNDLGSPYIQDLCEKLTDQRDGCSFLDLLVSTNRQIAINIDAIIKNKEFCQMPAYTSSLRKDISL